jgi:PelA/Pel-15E family pectate lyase
MIGVMSLLRDMAEQRADYRFVDDGRMSRVRLALRKGIECVLRTQIVVDGTKTAWCAQHDAKTLKPAPARSYEKISISGGESAGIVRFLMGVDKPNPRIKEAIQSAIAWFDRVKIEGLSIVRKPDDSEKGYDKVVVRDADAPPVWARFYEIGTNRPIFCGRDGIIKYSLAEIEHERRTGYSWYVSSPRDLLAKDYPAWQKKWTPNDNVLTK